MACLLLSGLFDVMVCLLLCGLFDVLWAMVWSDDLLVAEWAVQSEYLHKFELLNPTI
jgi:hypothetical protein